MTDSTTSTMSRVSLLTLATVAATLLIHTEHAHGSICRPTQSKDPYPLIIGMLSPASHSSDQSKQITFLQEIQSSGRIKNCFTDPTFINLTVNDTLRIPSEGWNNIKYGIERALDNADIDHGLMPTVVVGPFYSNLAMVLQQIMIPYVVTDYEGFDWIDMSRVQDTVNWKTVVEIRPPAQEQNMAVVDLFLYRKWMSAMMVMPSNAADNQECQNLASQMLENSLSIIPFTIEPRSSKVDIELSELLRNAQIFRQSQIIVCSPRDQRDELIKKILLAAKPFGLLNDESFSFILVDPSSFLKPFSGASEMYNLGLFSTRCELLAFRYVEPKLDHNTVGSKSSRGAKHEEKDAAVFDAGRITSLAMHHYITTQVGHSYKVDSVRFLESLRQVRLPTGATGHIEFNENGHRVNYTLQLYNHGGEHMYKKMAIWDPNLDSPETRLNMTGLGDDEQSFKQMGIFPEVVKIVLVEEKPFVMTRPDSDNLQGIAKYEGFTIDLIHRLAKELKFDYEVYMSPLNRYGGPVKGGRWDGMVEEILVGNATLACGSISITSARESVIDFSLGVISTGVNILIKKPEENLTIFQFMKPFSLSLWMAIMGASATVSLVFFVMDYCSGDNRRFTIRETIWFTIGTLLKRGTDFAPVPVSQRILTAGFLFFVLITVSTYTANMAAFLTTKNFEKVVDSLQALADSDDMSVSTVKGSATADLMEKGTEPLFHKLWGKIHQSGGLVDSAIDGQQRVKDGKVAFIFDYLINKALENSDCDVMGVGAPMLLQEHGIGMKPGAPFKSSINFALLRLKETGVMAGLKKKWWDDKRKCYATGEQNQRTGQVQFGVNHTAGVFIVGLFGVCVSALLFLNKKIYWCIRTAIERELKKRRDRKGGKTQNEANNVTGRERQKLFQGDKGEAV